jgi:hypothetical protein
MIEKYNALFQVFLAVYLVFALAFFRNPLKSAFLFLGFRTTCGLATFAGLQAAGVIQYFLPAIGLTALQSVIFLVFAPVRFRLNKVMRWFLIFAVLMLLTSAAAVVTGITDIHPRPGGVDELVKIITPIFIYILTYVGIKKPDDVSRANRWLLLTSVPCLLAGLVQVLTGVSYDYFTDTLSTGLRAVGTIGDPNAFGIYTSLMLFAALPSVMGQKVTVKAALSVCALLAIVVLGRNRGVWIADAVAVVGTVFAFRRRLKIGRWIAGMAAVAIIAAPVVILRFSELGQRDQYGQSQDTLSGRLAMHVALLEESLESPVIGFGPASSLERIAGAWMLPHNDYVRVIYEFGYLTALAYSCFLFSQLMLLRRYAGSSCWTQCFGGFALQICLLVCSLAYNPIADQILYSVIMASLAITHRAIALLPVTDAAPSRKHRQGGRYPFTDARKGAKTLASTSFATPAGAKC